MKRGIFALIAVMLVLLASCESRKGDGKACKYQYECGTCNGRGYYEADCLGGFCDRDLFGEYVDE